MEASLEPGLLALSVPGAIGKLGGTALLCCCTAVAASHKDVVLLATGQKRQLQCISDMLVSARQALTCIGFAGGCVHASQSEGNGGARQS